MDERQIERNLRDMARKSGGLALKFTSPGFDGMPDRVVLMPGGRIAFVEVKAPGKKPRPLQLSRHETLRRLGFKVYVLDGVFLTSFWICFLFGKPLLSLRRV